MSAPQRAEYPPPAPDLTPRKQRIAGWVVTGIAILFLLFSGLIKFTGSPEVDASMDRLGYPRQLVHPLGFLEIGCVVIHLIPRTRFLGALLLTAHLGGATATHVRVGDPLFSHVLFPSYVGILIWLGYWLRDARIRVLGPLTQPTTN